MANFSDEYFKALDILMQNQDKNFVQRILESDKFPKLADGNGGYATHKMSWASTADKDGKEQYVVYPTVIYDGKQLRELKPDEAFDYAMKNNEYVKFSNPTDANWFSQRYKAAWGQQGDPNKSYFVKPEGY